MPLGALLADLREFDEAERAYRRALGDYRMCRRSPWPGFASSWACCGENSFPNRNGPGREMVPEGDRVFA